ncbi:hypothetical protein GTP45_07170 [Pseudoduganella sp. FT55W]|uniref:Uncharacterized protein n=1 Tax=Duganella rivi TaxID=2666083 RepID=A0A7X4GN72_9BURK|nr:hypothetical protein [Duganella rivi]MYM66612.1 hypothetical protein [Duganella rivi]
MEKLTFELQRLYLFAGQQLDGAALDLVNAAGMVRTLVIDFHKAAEEQHWARLCDVANALQTELGLPAPAVSVSGGECYRLWLSLEQPIPETQAKQFLALLHKAYFEDEQIDFGRSRIDLPPSQNRATGLWAAFVNPSMGGALAEDLGLEMMPPEAAQAAFLERLSSITEEEFAQALAKLRGKQDAAAQAPAAASAPPARDAHTTPAGLLLKDATLEQIVLHLHAMGIEPTFRHVLKN